MDQTAPRFEFLMNLSVDVGEIVTMGQAPIGERRVVSITGGTFEGPGMRGEVLPGGNDWQIQRADGVLDIDAGYVLKEERGGLVRVISQGYRYGPPEVIAAMARGEDLAVNGRQYIGRGQVAHERQTADQQRIGNGHANGHGAQQAENEYRDGHGRASAPCTAA